MSQSSKDDVSFLDVTGSPLFVGAKVAWGAAHRAGGVAVGEVIDLEIRESAPKRWDAATKAYTEGPTVYTGYIVTRSLMRGRKGQTISAEYAGVVLIANQEWPGDR